MDIKLRLEDGHSLTLGSKREDIEAELKQADVHYDVLYNKEDKQGMLETIMSIRKYRIELHMQNNVLILLSAGNNKFNHILKREELSKNIAADMKVIQDNICNILDLPLGYPLKLEKLDTKNLNSMLIADTGDAKVRIGIAQDGSGNIYINTIRLLDTSIATSIKRVGISGAVQG